MSCCKNNKDNSPQTHASIKELNDKIKELEERINKQQEEIEFLKTKSNPKYGTY